MMILAYHSQNVTGSTYAANDHVAFASDLETITQCGRQIVPLTRIVEAINGGEVEASGKLVALTFDDGPVFDVEDFVHPRLGKQRSFLNLMKDFRARHHASRQPALHATSFVIASPSARRDMERAEGVGLTHIRSWLSDSWWPEAEASGLLGIGNHSWDRARDPIPVIGAPPEEAGDFSRVDNYAAADREIRQATVFIRGKVRGPCEMFAYPSGRVSEYLQQDYFPTKQEQHGIKAAFTTAGGAVAEGNSLWSIPRAVCGEHWTSPSQLKALLS